MDTIEGNSTAAHNPFFFLPSVTTTLTVADLTSSQNLLSVFLICLGSYLFWNQLKSWTHKPLPPGPFPWPILGNLPNIIAGGPLPHVTLAKLAQKYGKVCSVWLGSNLMVVISDPKVVEEVFREKDEACSSRPCPESLKILTFGGKGIVFAPSGPAHKLVRKLCTTHLFTKRQLDRMRPIRLDEVRRMCDAIKIEAAHREGLVLLRPLVFRTSANNMMRMSLSKRYDFSLPGKPSPAGDHYFTMIEETMAFAGAFNIADHVPILRPFDPAGVVRQCKKACAYQHKHISEAIEDHEQRLAEAKASGNDGSMEARDFCDALLMAPENERLERLDMIAVIQDLLAAGSDTSATTVEWALLELLRHPENLQKVREEVETVLGPAEKEHSMDDSTIESRLLELPYLRAVVKETLRLYSPGPFLLPHFTVQAVELCGGKYYVPANTVLQVNVWAMARDDSIWENGKEFRPERFLEEEIEYRGTYRYIIFGAGRRSCPGMTLGHTLVVLMLAHLIHAFDMKEGPAGLDIAERNGLTVQPLTPLEPIMSPRV